MNEMTIVRICWFRLWQLDCNARNGQYKGVLSVLQSVQFGCGAHPTSHPLDTGRLCGR